MMFRTVRALLLAVAAFFAAPALAQPVPPERNLCVLKKGATTMTATSA